MQRELNDRRKRIHVVMPCRCCGDSDASWQRARGEEGKTSSKPGSAVVRLDLQPENLMRVLEIPHEIAMPRRTEEAAVNSAEGIESWEGDDSFTSA
eukprot:763163-Hanusia_phi.AAC.4